MIPFARAADFSPQITALSGDFMDWPYLSGIFGKLPENFRGPVAESYGEKRQKAGQQAANLWIGGIGRRVTTRRAALASSDAEICAAAESCAKEVQRVLMSTVGESSESMLSVLVAFAAEQGVAVPDDNGLSWLVGRMSDAAWWRRQLRRNVARKVEAEAIGLGMVHRFAGVYASDETVQRHGEQMRRNAAALENTIARNEEGQEYTLAELSEVGISNPAIRRAELMTRIRGFEDYAKESGHVGRFYTWTAPSRYHARLSRSGQSNPKYQGATPRDAQAVLSKQWAKARAWMNRRGLFPYGFRVAEPHHDGTPHWHMLLFIRADVADTVTKCIRDYAMEPDADELTSKEAIEARFKCVSIDWERGSAAGYIAKYVCKNIDGKKTTGEAVTFDKAEGDDYQGGAVEGAARVRAWASTWGIRQFQQIGGPGVTVWRELRRIREDEEKKVQGELFPFWGQADKGNWHGYVRQMGGIEIARADRPVQVWREQIAGKRNRYGEEAAPEICGVLLHGVGYETRVHQWEIRRVANGAAKSKQRGAALVSASSVAVPVRGEFRQAAPHSAKGTQGGVCFEHESQQPGVLGFDFSSRVAAPWTRVNNCTRDADGLEVGGPIPAPGVWPGYDDTGAIVKAAQVSAVLGRIRDRRQRGAFGQFPKLEG